MSVTHTNQQGKGSYLQTPPIFHLLFPRHRVKDHTFWVFTNRLTCDSKRLVCSAFIKQVIITLHIPPNNRINIHRTIPRRCIILWWACFCACLCLFTRNNLTPPRADKTGESVGGGGRSSSHRTSRPKTSPRENLQLRIEGGRERGRESLSLPHPSLHSPYSSGISHITTTLSWLVPITCGAKWTVGK